MEKKVILFNGPPSSGKDASTMSAVNFLIGKRARDEQIPFRPTHLKFADPLKHAAHVLYNIPLSADYYEKEFGNEWKNKPAIEFFGATPRSEYIALSEEFAKVRHGQEVFGRVAARRIQLDKSNNVFIFSDSGFVPEAVEVLREVGIDNIAVVELSRPGTSFAGDSRGFITEELVKQFPKLYHKSIPNIGSRDLLRKMVCATVAEFLNIDME